MTYKAGSRLFEAIGQIPDEMIIEAEEDVLKEDALKEDVFEEDTIKEDKIAGHKEILAGQESGSYVNDSDENKKQILRRKKHRVNIGAYLKYLPVAACLCIVFYTAVFVVQNVQMKNRDGAGFKGSLSGYNENAMDHIVEDAKQDTGQESTGETAGAADSSQDGISTDRNENSAEPILPMRYDAYEGPVLALTATGDTQSLQTTRKLEGNVQSVSYENRVQPVLDVTDSYRIKNTSREDKTVQLVYPFAASMNLEYGFEDTVLQVAGEELDISYGIGDGVAAYLGTGPKEPAKLSDYRLLLEQETDYQEDALQKEADWDKEVCVYFFTDIQVQEDCTGVVGVTVTGEDADVLTYGFDYAAPVGEEGSANYCFFAPKDHSRIMLIVTGEQQGEPQLGYYTNLDCEETAEGIACNINRQYMSYADALRLCSESMAGQIEQRYEEQVYAGSLPSYVNEDTVYQALTVMGDEDTFFDTLSKRYQSTDLEEIYEILFSQMRIVYAMAMVTIPAKESVYVTAHIQQRQMEGNYMLLADQKAKSKDYRYDFLTIRKNRLNIEKTVYTLKLSSGWQLAADNIGLRQKKSIWEAKTEKELYYVTIKEK